MATWLQQVSRFFGSSIGAKVLMSLTGVVIWGFAIGHTAGNLQIFLPAPDGGYTGQQINEYAAFLHATPPLLWGTRILLLVCFPLHIVYGLKLARANKAARSQRYAVVAYERSNIASRLMALSGVVLLVFMVFHLAHFTFHWVHPGFATMTDQEGLHDVHGMVWQGFGYVGVAVGYVIAQSLLFLHLYHGSVSFLQSLGIRHYAWTPVAAIAGRLLVIFVVAGNIAMPVALAASWLVHK
jgi:succinate dehydrogenase / fumarate reductase cytochrome b subunit